MIYDIIKGRILGHYAPKFSTCSGGQVYVLPKKYTMRQLGKGAKKKVLFSEPAVHFGLTPPPPN